MIRLHNELKRCSLKRLANNGLDKDALKKRARTCQPERSPLRRMTDAT